MPPGGKRVTFWFPQHLLPGGAARAVAAATDAPVVDSWLLGTKSASVVADDTLQYESAGGCHLTFRTALVKLTGMKLFGIGVACALVAASGANNDISSARSCALSASVCLVASYFYYLIWQVRRQGWEGGPFETALLNPIAGDGKGANVLPEKKLHMQEQAVDGLRQTDWTITLVLMAIETHTMIDKLSNGRAPPIMSMLVSALVQPLVVQVGTIPRFYMNNLRGGPDGPATGFEWFFGILLFALALTAWVFTTLNTVGHIGTINDTNYPDATDQAEAIALWWLAVGQFVYPLVAIIDWFVMAPFWEWTTYNAYSPRLSTFKDIAYATADVSTKAGMALVAFLVATRVQ